MDTCKQNMQPNNIASMRDCNCDDMKNKKMSEKLYKSAQKYMCEDNAEMENRSKMSEKLFKSTQNYMCEDNAEMENRSKMCRKPTMVESYINNYGCPCVDNMPLAMAYVPWQEFNTVYESDEALARGTIFPELDLPFYGRSCK